VPIVEKKICFSYELAREVVLQDGNSELANAMLKLREAAGDLSFDAAVDRGFFLFFRGVGFLVPVFYPEWPQHPYLSIDQGERQHRANRLKPHRSTDQESLRFLFERRPGDISITLHFPSNLYFDEAKPLFDSLVRRMFPERNRKAGGRRASPEHIRDRLFALAALRLKRQRLPRRQIIETLKDGKAKRFASEKALEKPLKNAEKWLEDCRTGWPHIIGTFIATTLRFVLISPQAVIENLYQQLQEALRLMAEAERLLAEAKKGDHR
jgi:hypothetical protein